MLPVATAPSFIRNVLIKNFLCCDHDIGKRGRNIRKKQQLHFEANIAEFQYDVDVASGYFTYNATSSSNKYIHVLSMIAN